MSGWVCWFAIIWVVLHAPVGQGQGRGVHGLSG